MRNAIFERLPVRGWEEGGVEFQGLQGDSDLFIEERKGTRSHLSPGRHTTPFHVSSPTPHPQPGIPIPPHLPHRSPSHQSPSADYINTPRAGPRQRIMVHREVTGKENRGLRMAKSTRDKHRDTLKDLDKGLTNHVGNETHFLKWE